MFPMQEVFLCSVLMMVDLGKRYLVYFPVLLVCVQPVQDYDHDVKQVVVGIYEFTVFNTKLKYQTWIENVPTYVL